MAARNLGIKVYANTDEANKALDKTKAKIIEFGKASGGSAIETRAAFSVLRGNVNNANIVVARFLNTIKGVAPVVHAMFPLFGAIAFGAILVKIATNVEDFLRKIRETPIRIAQSFRVLDTELITRIDELHLSTDKLNNDLARLQGRPQNTLKIMLDEAAIAADSLSKELDDIIRKIEDTMKKESISAFRALFTGETRTYGEEVSFTQFGAALGEAGARMRDAVRLAREHGSETEKVTAQIKGQTEIQGLLNAKIREYQTLLKRSNPVLPTLPSEGAPVTTEELVKAAKGPLPKTSPTTDVARYQGMVNELRNALDIVNAQLDELTAKDKTFKAQTGEEASAAVRPYTNLVKTLNADIAATRDKAESIGKVPSYQILAEAAANAKKAIAKLHEEMDKGGKAPVTAQQEAEIRELELSKAQEDATLKNAEAYMKATIATKDRIAAAERLTAAIGKGIEATKAAEVENRLQAEFGQRYYDPAAGFAIASRRPQIAKEVNAERNEAIGKTLLKLQDEIDLEKAVESTITQGALKIKEAEEAVKVAKERRDQGDEVAARQAELFAIQRRVEAAKEITAINLKIASTQRLISAQGQQAKLEAEIANTRAEVTQTHGAAAGELAAQEKRLSEALAIHEEADKLIHSYEDQLVNLQKISVEIEWERVIGASVLETNLANKKVIEEQLAIVHNLALAEGGIHNQVLAFFADMKSESLVASETFYKAMHSALDKLSDDFAKILTGQVKEKDIKSTFAKTFQGLGGELLQGSLKNLGTKGLAELGTHLPGKLGDILRSASKTHPDGTEKNPWWVKIVGAGGGGGNIPGTLVPSALGKLLGVGGGGGALPAGFSQALSFLPGLASGGDDLGSGAYLVGDDGPEILSIGDRASGSASVIPIDRGGAGSGNVTYNVHAPGADLGAANRISRALEATHNSAVVQSARTQYERSRRTPRHTSTR